MSVKAFISISVALTVAVLLAACSPAPVQAPEEAAPEQQAPSAPPDQLMAKWMELAKSATLQKPNIQETLDIAQQIAQQDPKALAPLIEVLADPASSPFTKIAASFSLKAGLTPEMRPRLTELVKPEVEATTRSCATELLGALPGKEATALLVQLSTDPERRVKFQAVRALAVRNNKYRPALFDMYKSPETSPQEKGSIVAALCATIVAPDSIPVFQEAAADTKLDERARLMAIESMGQIGDRNVLTELNELAQNDPSQKIKEAAMTAIQGVQTRIDAIAAEAPAQPAQPEQK